MDLDITKTIMEWTRSEYTHTLEEFEGSLHMRERILEDPSNTLYMLYPNGPSQKCPYPGIYTPYSYLAEVDIPMESDSMESTDGMHEMQDVTNVNVKARKPGSSEHSPRKGSASMRKVASPRKPASPRKNASPRKPTSLRKPFSPMKTSSVPKIPSALRNEIMKGLE